MYTTFGTIVTAVVTPFAADGSVDHDELRRILRPGGVLCITDPCPDHLRAPSRWRLFRDHGWRALYFHALARFVYEPFLADWHSITDHRAWFDAHGFELVTREVSIPFSTLVARRR